MTEDIKTVGKTGQISIGKKLAGKTVRVEYREDGSIVLTPVIVVPEGQAWMWQEPHRSKIERALRWAAENPAQETDLDAFLADAEKKRTAKRKHEPQK